MGISYPGVARVEDRKKKKERKKMERKEEKNERDDSTVNGINGEASKCPIRVRERVTRGTSSGWSSLRHPLSLI